MSIRRFIGQKIQKLSQNFKIVLLTGARQVGKSNLLTSLFPNAAHYVFDPNTDRWSARRDPDHFFQTLKPPVIFDDIQYVMEVLPALKSFVNASDKKGLIFLTGVHNIHMFKKIKDDLSEYMAVIELKGLTLFERANQADWLKKLLTGSQKLLLDFSGCVAVADTLPELILRGNLPETALMPVNVVRNYHAFCIKMYLENDICPLDNPPDLTKFAQFMALMGTHTAKPIDLAEMSRTCNISLEIAESWLNLLVVSYQCLLIPEFSLNKIPSVSQKNMGHFTDTGLACHLLGITTIDALEQYPQYQYLFKSYCVNMIDALNQALLNPVKLSYLRGKNAVAVDVILECDGNYFPIEITLKTKVLREDIVGLQAFLDAYPDATVPLALILHTGTECYFVGEKILAMPWNAVIQ